MITKPTVLILGAGASTSYGFPLGRKLRDLVCHYDNLPKETIEAAGLDLSDVEQFVNTLRHSGYSSVDWFLEDYQEFMTVGKAVIASCLIPLERPERLFPPAAPQEHWYELLLNALDTPRGAFKENRLSIITFNYERSLEHYLFTVLATRYHSEDVAREYLNSLQIIHVHGSLGYLAPLVPDGRLYAPTLTPDSILTAAKQIIVLGEASDDTQAFEQARKVLRDAERISFLGFGFHPKSLRRLEVFNEPWDDDHRQRVIVNGTSIGIPNHAWNEIRTNSLNQAIPPERRHRTEVFRYLNDHEPL